MSQALQIAELKSEIEELIKENLRLKSEKSRTVKKFIEVPPPDYQKLKQHCLSVADDLE